MAKTLIIKGANFSANKVDTVEFDTVHTESITIDDDSISINTIGGTHTIQYTLTPINAGDPVAWESSDTSVCTVDEYGVVTSTGVGTATITGTSNGHSDTVSVVCVNELTGFGRYIKTTMVPNNSSGHAATMDCYCGTTSTGYDIYLLMVATDSTQQKLNTFYTYARLDEETQKYYIPDEPDPSEPGYYRIMTYVGYPVPITIPSGCSSIKAVALNEHYAPYVIWFKSETRANNNDTNQLYFSAYKKASPTPNNYSWVFQKETTITVEDGYDSIAILWKADTANGAVDFANLTAEQIAEFKVLCS